MSSPCGESSQSVSSGLGRPSELSDDQLEQFATVLEDRPEEAGYDVPAWSSALAQQYLIKAFDVMFSRRHVRRLMHEAKVSPKRLRPQPAFADEDERKEFEETLEKVGRRDEDATVVTIDQTRKAVGADLSRAWFPWARGRKSGCRPLAKG